MRRAEAWAEIYFERMENDLAKRLQPVKEGTGLWSESADIICNFMADCARAYARERAEPLEKTIRQLLLACETLMDEVTHQKATK